MQTLVPDTIAKPVLGALTQFAAKASRLGSVGLVVLLFTAIALMLTIDRTLNAIWRVRTPRPIAQRVLVYWAAVTLGPLILGVSLSLTSYAISASSGLVGAMPGSVTVLLGVLQFVLLTAAVAGLFHYVPNTLVLWRHAFAGGLFVAVGFEIAKRALAWYVQSVPTYSNVYGAFATVPIFLVWLYLGWVIVLLGAVVAAYAPSLQMRVVRRPPTPGHRFALAVAVLRELVAARRSQRHGMSITELAQRLRTAPLLSVPILDRLVEMDWAARLDEAGAQRHVLLCEPAATPVRPLVAALLLDPTAEVGGFWQRAGLETMMLAEVLDGA
jgi:membrane protein